MRIKLRVMTTQFLDSEDGKIDCVEVWECNRARVGQILGENMDLTGGTRV